MNDGETYDLNEIERFGDPWHGLVKGGVIELPNSSTRDLAGETPVGGDCFRVQRPSQAAVTTSSADAAEGMEWRNYGLIYGSQHILYGVALNELSWLYIADDETVWRVQYANGSGDLTFTRFGLLGEDPAAVAQTISLSGTDTGYITRCLDLTATGSKALIGSTVESVYYMASRAAANILGGVYLIEISGTPPAASATFTVLADEEACRGTASNTRSVYAERFTTVAAPDPSSGLPWPDTSTYEQVDWDYSYATDSGDPNTAPALPSGKYYTYSNGMGGVYLTASWIVAIASPVDLINGAAASGGTYTYSGAKQKTGVVIGATFAGGATAQLVTVDMSLTDSNSGLAITREGTLALKIGATSIETLNFASTYGDGTYTLNLGDIYTNTSAASLMAGFAVLDIFTDDTHVLIAGPGTGETIEGLNSSGELAYGAYSGQWLTRFIPVRYSSNAYGFLYIRGAGWTLTPWNENDGLLSQRHYARSVFGGARDDLTVPTRSISGSYNQPRQRLGFATVQPVTNVLELSDEEVVFK